MPTSDNIISLSLRDRWIWEVVKSGALDGPNPEAESKCVRTSVFSVFVPNIACGKNTIFVKCFSYWLQPFLSQDALTVHLP